MNADMNNQLREEEMGIIDRHRLCFLDIFPEDIWYLLAKQDPDTVESMFNSSLYLRSLWLNRRTTFLFPKVWQIVSKRCIDVLTRRRNVNETEFFFGWSSDAEHSEILNFRKVCKSWSNVFDNCYHLPRPDTIEDHHFHIAALRKKINCEFFTDEIRAARNKTTSKFLDHYKSTHDGSRTKVRSPFVGNSLCVTYAESDEIPEDDAFYQRIIEIVSKYGQHVRHLSLVEKLTEDDLRGYKKLQTILNATPHLKSLSIHHNVVEIYPTFRPRLQDEKLENLITHIAQNPLPTFQSLESLKISGNGFLCIWYELLARNSHISQLVISNLSVAEYSILITPLANLRELSLTIYLNEELEALLDSRLNWPLTKLSVDLYEDFPFIDWFTLFSVLESKWSDTLSELLLKIPPRIRGTPLSMLDTISAKLYLKNIKKLKLNFCCYCSLDFILPLKDTLEYLSIQDSTDPYEYNQVDEIGSAVEKMEMVKFWSYNNTLLKSNVWTHFPKLDRLQYYRGSEYYRVFTRLEWQQELIRSKMRFRQNCIDSLLIVAGILAVLICHLVVLWVLIVLWSKLNE